MISKGLTGRDRSRFHGARRFAAVLAAAIVSWLGGRCEGAEVGTLKWRFSAGTHSLQSPAVGLDGAVYTTCANGRLYALDGQTGATLWEFDTDGYLTEAAVLGWDNDVYVCGRWIASSNAATLHALDSSSGKEKWRFAAPSPLDCPPVVGLSRVLYLADNAHTLHALDTLSGDPIWSAEVPCHPSTPPAIGLDGTLYVVTDDRRLLALDARTGSPKWQFATGVLPSGPLSLGEDGTVYVALGDSRLLAVDGATGRKRWEFSTGAQTYSTEGISGSAVLGDVGDLYVGGRNGKLYRLDAMTGDKRWEYQLPSGAAPTPALAADGALYVGTFNSLLALDRDTGSKRWEAEAQSGSPSPAAIAPDGTVYFSGSATLYAVQGNAGLTPSSWPKHQGDLGQRGSIERSGAPILVRPPQGGVGAAERPLLLGAMATGTGPLAYQWYHGDALLADATGSVYSIAAFGPEHAGEYWVSVSNALGSVASERATVAFGYPIDVTVRGVGSVAAQPEREAYEPGTRVTLTAQPAGTRRFLGWTGDSDGTNAAIQVTVDRALRLDASFEILPGDPLWSLPCSFNLDGTLPMDDDGTVYAVQVLERTLYAMEPSTGRSRPLFHPGDPLGSPVVGNAGAILIGCLDGKLYAVDRANGNPIWACPTDGAVTEPPGVGIEGTVFFGSADGYLYAAAEESGKVKWKHAAGGVVGSPVIGGDGTVFVGTGSNFLLAVNGTTGEEKWGARVCGAKGFLAVGAEGTLYAASEYGYVFGLEPSSGAKKWEFRAYTGISLFGPVISPMAVDAQGRVFLGTRGRFFALDGQTGAEKWRFHSPDGFSTPAIGEDGTVYLGVGDKWLRAFDAATGAEKWSFRGTGSMAAYGLCLTPSQELYVLSDGNLRAFQASSGPATSSWSKYRGNLRNTGSAQRPGPPSILWQTPGSTNAAGSALDLSVRVTGTPPFRYRWFKDGLPLPEATNEAVSIPSLDANTVGVYHVVVENPQGSARGADIPLAVHFTLEAGAAGPGRLTQEPELTRYDPGAVVVLTATPDPGRQFLGWEGDLSGTNLEVRVTMDRNLRVVARFQTSPGEKLWQFTTGSVIYGSPALGIDDSLLIGSRDMNLYSLNRFTGRKRWSFPTGGWVDSAPAVGLDGDVYFASADGSLYAVDGRRGTQKWALGIAGSLPPAIGADGTVYLAANGVFAIAPENGATNWFARPESAIPSSPAIGPDGTVYVPFSSGVVSALNGATGGKRWRTEILGVSGAAPELAIGRGGVIYAMTANGGLAALLGQTGELLWQAAAPSGFGVAGGLAVAPSGTFIGCRGGMLGAWESVGGTARWTRSFAVGQGRAPALGADGTGYLGSTDGKLYAFDFNTGSNRWAFAVGRSISSSPTIAPDGTVYFGCTDRNVYAVHGNSAVGLAESPWPKYRQGANNAARMPPDLGENPEIVSLVGAGLAAPGDAHRLAVVATGVAPLAYQWHFEGQPLTNATNAVHDIESAGPETVGDYQVVVSNARGEVRGEVMRVELGYRCDVSAPQGHAIRIPDQPLYALGAKVRLEARPEERWQFVGWSGALKSTNVSETVTIDRDLFLEAQFEPLLGAAVWEARISGTIPQGIAVGSNGAVCFGTSRGTVYALDGENGRERWSTNLANEECAPVAVGEDGSVFLGWSSGAFRALDAASGAVHWSFQAGGAISSGPALASDGGVYVGSVDGKLHALNAADGGRLWQFTASDPIESTPAIGLSNTLYFTCSATTVYALDRRTGRKLWVSTLLPNLKLRMLTPALGLDGTLVASAQGSIQTWVLEAATGNTRWNLKSSGFATPTDPLVDADGSVYLRWDTLQWGALRPNNGSQRDALFLSPSGTTPLLGSRGRVYHWNLRGTLDCLNREDGTTNWVSVTRPGLFKVSLAIGPNGFVYAASPTNTDNWICAFKADARLEGAAPWPKPNHDNRNSADISVLAGNRPPIFLETSDRTIQSGESLALTVSALDPDGDPIRYRLGEDAPDGLAVDARTGSISWTPPEALWSSTNRIVVIAEDEDGGRATNRFAVYVHDPRRRWTNSADLWLTGSPGLAEDGTVYVASAGGAIQAFDGATGEWRWRQGDVSRLNGSPVLGTNGLLYSCAWNLSVYALDRREGTVEWETRLDSPASPPALGNDGILYVGTTNGGLYALDARSGRQQWFLAVPGGVITAPAISASGRLFFGSAGNRFRAMDPAQPRLEWELSTDGPTLGAAAIGDDGTVYLGCGDGYLYAVEGSNGSQRWRARVGSSVEAAPIVGPDGAVYLGALDGTFQAFDGDTGHPRWGTRLGGGVTAAAALAADGTVYVGSDDRRLYALDSATGTQKWSHLVQARIRTSPTIAPEGTVVFGADDGIVHALNGGPEATLASGPWPKWQANTRNTGTTIGTLPPVPTAPRCRQIELTTEGRLRLSWEVEAGATYRLESCDGLPSKEWADSGNQWTASDATLVVDIALGSGSERYYRLQRLPLPR